MFLNVKAHFQRGVRWTSKCSVSRTEESSIQSDACGDRENRVVRNGTKSRACGDEGTNGMISFGPLASRLNRIPTAVLFAYLTIFLPCPFLRLPQRDIQFFVPLHRSQTAYLV